MHANSSMKCHKGFFVSWTSLLSAYVKVGSHEEALGLFNLMMISWECPIEFTLSNVFWACSALWDSTLGTKIHIYAIKNGFGSNHILSSNLIDFHSKCSNTVGAYNIFRNMQNADNISWTTMISSFEKEGNWIKVVGLFLDMIKLRISPNEYTFAKILRACSGLGSINYGNLSMGR